MTSRKFISNFTLRVLLLIIVTVFIGCSSKPQSNKTAPGLTTDPIADLINDAAPSSGALGKMGYSVQVGAFANLDNAVNLEQALEARGIDAYYFRHKSGLYKVRFGNHSTYNSARGEAEALQRQQLIDSFFIVIPEAYAAARIQKSGKGDLRAELVLTAKRFIGVPYRWGGESSVNGFDCSGLTMVCYRLNGLNLQRNSRAQYKTGRSVRKSQLRKGDLVFFATGGGKRVSHVGMYIGDGKFIHAPRTGKKVRIENLSNSFFTRTYVGGRTYL